MIRVLIVDDDAMLRDTLEIDLARRGHAVETCASAAEALAAMQRADFDVVVTDLSMREVDGIQLCERIVATRSDVPVLVLTAFGSFESAVAAMRAGAYDFLSKPIELEALAFAIGRAANHRKLRGELQRLQRELGTPSEMRESIVATSTAMREVLDLVERVAPSDTNVLLTGESGTGKEMISRAIHESGRRAKGPFVAINCAAMPEALLESELFGHVKGAFTDARSTEPGLFVAAQGGTLFLDEIGEMPLPVQPKLLRVLQERRVRAVGATAERAVDVRVIAATNRDLETAMEEGRFREDLYYRINVLKIALPPLRARVSDILPLAMSFVGESARRMSKNVTRIGPPAAERLLAYPWPGNVRELQNSMEHAVALANLEEIGLNDLPEKIRGYRSTHVLLAAEDASELVTLEEVERRYIARVLEAVQSNKSAAARVLGIDRKRLYRFMERLGLAAKEPP
jgi:two-component system, NtrC family, response regulator AtoC